MPANEYQFLTEWRVAAPIETIYDILKEGKDYPRWWPDVYLAARAQPSGQPEGLGDRVTFLTKGRLPYRLRWTAEVVRQERPRLIEIAATGDLVGRGVWRLVPDGTETLIAFDWRIQADKPLLRWLSPLFKPLFAWNHRWAMATGLGRLRAEAARRPGQAAAPASVLR